ncbi:MAG: paraquat-inducible protein B, partial [Rhodothermales bacterium]
MSEELRIPQASSRPRRSGHWAWAVPGVTIVLAVIICWAAIGRHGPEIEIRFSDGHGLKPGDSLRHRGIAIGKVERVLPTPELDGVRVELTLAEEAAAVAREGSQFWIVRPQVNLTEVSGLDTVVGANYVAVSPGDGADTREFLGLEGAPIQGVLDPAGLRIRVEALERGSLRAGGNVLYRQTQVGRILTVALAGDANGVIAELYVQPEYRALVRGGSHFWDAGGVRMEAGITGVSVEMDSMASMVAGGIAFATPPDAGPAAKNGDEFAMFAEAEKEWIDWQPSIHFGPVPGALPPLVRGTLRWKTEGIFDGNDVRSGWVVGLNKKRLLGLGELLRPADGGGGTLRVGQGDAREIAEPATALGGLATLLWTVDEFWPTAKIRVPESPEDVLIVGDPQAAPRAVSGSRFEAVSGGWKLPRAAKFSEDWHGAAGLGQDGF